MSVAPNAGQNKAGQSDFPHFAIQASPGENEENTDCLSFHMKNRGLRMSATRGRGKFGKCADGNNAENADDWPYGDGNPTERNCPRNILI